MIRLAHGVVAGRDHRVWAPGHFGVPESASSTELSGGAPVAIGPASAQVAVVEEALRELRRLVALAERDLVAGAGIDLGHGFRSARVEGARGDRRDAVLAALRVLPLESHSRLGDRRGVVVALFGPDATKPVAAAAVRAIAEQRWSALTLASAASDLLGPEQVEQILALRAPDGVDPFPHGLASDLAVHLSTILDGFSRRRRFALLCSLWERVCEHQIAKIRRSRLTALRSPGDRRFRVEQRYEAFEDELIMESARRGLGANPRPAMLARMVPSLGYWHSRWCRLIRDTIAATALLRAAIAVAESSLVEGLSQCSAELSVAAGLLDDGEQGAARRRVPGQHGIPARPSCYVRDILREFTAAQQRNGELDQKSAAYIRQRLANAFDYAYALVLCIGEFTAAFLALPGELVLKRPCFEEHLGAWRRIAGFRRQPRSWAQPPMFAEGGTRDPLSGRLDADPEADPIETETANDLLWYADLGDLLARTHGHPEARIEYTDEGPLQNFDPAPEDPDPLTPRLDSIPQAVTGVAQLVGLGARPSESPRTWDALVDDVTGNAQVAEALAGVFRTPGPLLATDGALVPDTELRVEWARTASQLAEWSAYMGNCIATPVYLEDAAAGDCGLAALRGADGQIAANLDVRPTGGRGTGWYVDEIQARFNADVDPTLLKAIRAWVATIPPARAPRGAGSPVPRAHGVRPRRTARTRRVVAEVGGRLEALARQELNAADWLDGMAVLGTLAPDREPDAVPTALRRMPSARLTSLTLQGLASIGLVRLWDATAVRPLSRALADLAPTPMENLAVLTEDVPLPKARRRLARLESVGIARTSEIVARRIRRAIGTAVADDDPALARQIRGGVPTDVLCALVAAVNGIESGGPSDAPRTPVTGPTSTEVPGFPPSDLADPDGPWRRAWPDAEELGSDDATYRWHASTSGLLVPDHWLPRGGWPALWRRSFTVRSR